MIQNYEELLLNFLFIFIPFLLFQTFWLDKGRVHHTYSKVIMTILGVVSIILCMTHPITFSEGIIFDLRQIPFILGFLYYGWRVGTVLYLAIIVTRFLIGGDGIYISFAATTLLFLVLPLLKKDYHKFSLRGKMISITLISAIIALLVIALSYMASDGLAYHQYSTSINFVIIQGLGALSAAFIVESTIKNLRMREDLFKTEKLKVISELAASVSHEVRNPITVSKGFLQLLMSPEVSYENRKSYADLSLKELERAEVIINDYLSITKTKPEKNIVATMEDDVYYIANVLKPYALIHNVKITTDIHNDLLVKYNQHQLQQSLINFAKNSIEAMPDGGLLSVELRSSNSKVIISIKDTGVGMTKEQISQLGEAYYTTKETGTGLGMMVSYSAIYAMNGKIKVESEVGKGTEFQIILEEYQDR
ncbi:sensor histidine kinase [Paraliobacillus quinghaiensis]|uniref:histidine kinase n=1 Tax=Paraliobacillus quinghaiensis TaxID=470815 RepID=A0A917TFE7_9BACI|nr:ATP-binding protein [Paraliobacillus quinghaiensis]GGM18705.1 sensor histidine kinase [Paraliobacillus quinghaiensis]